MIRGGTVEFNIGKGRHGDETFNFTGHNNGKTIKGSSYISNSKDKPL